MQTTQAVKFGTDFARMYPAIFKTPGGNAVAATELFSGIHNDKLADGHSTDGMICWEISRPYPGAMLALGGFLVTQDKN